MSSYFAEPPKDNKLRDEAYEKVNELGEKAKVNGTQERVREEIKKCTDDHRDCDSKVTDLVNNARSPVRKMYESLFGQPSGHVECSEVQLSCVNNVSP